MADARVFSARPAGVFQSACSVTLTPYALELGHGLRDQPIGYAGIVHERGSDPLVSLSCQEFRVQKKARADPRFTPRSGVIPGVPFQGFQIVLHGANPL